MNDTLSVQKPLARLGERFLRVTGQFLRLIPSNMRMRVPFGINRGQIWIRGAANAPEWLGIYEYRKQRLLRRLVLRGMTVCDVGANAGFYTLALSRMVGPTGHVIAFEPLPVNLNKIERHLELNKIDNVTLSRCALSKTTGRVTFQIGENDFTGQLSKKNNGGIEVGTISLDEFIAQQGIADPMFLKIDVEGAEANVLVGARELIRRAHPSMLIALHGPEAASDCYAILREAGYAVKTLSGTEIKTAEAMRAEILAM